MNNDNDLQNAFEKALQDVLERGSEPYWMQDVRCAQRRIDAHRLAMRAQRACPGRSNSKPVDDV